MNQPIKILCWASTLTLCITTGAFGLDKQVVGGWDVDNTGDYPWQVALLNTLKVETMSDHNCGGTLIHPQWILSAAHCFLDENGSIELPASDLVLIGETNIIGKMSNYSGRYLIIHELYGPPTKTYDVALLRLVDPIKDVPPVTLANHTHDNENVITGRKTFALGWGFTTPKDPESKSEILQGVDLPIVKHAVCQEKTNTPVPHMMLCAGKIGSGQDTCTDDSGGGLFLADEKKNTVMQIGIVSHGPQNCGQDGYGKYMKTSVVKNWIEKKLNLYGDSLSDGQLTSCTEEQIKAGIC